MTIKSRIRNSILILWQKRSRYTFSAIGTIAGIVLSNTLHLSCTPEQEPKWPIDIILQHEFVTYTSVDAIPRSIVDAISNPDDIKAIAEPGEDYNENLLYDENLSSRRLIFAGQSKKHWFVYYELGHRQISRNKLELFEYPGEPIVPRFEIQFLFFPNAQNVEVLRRQIVSTKKLFVATD